MFGRATIRLGIGPHSSVFFYYCCALYYAGFVHTLIMTFLFNASYGKCGILVMSRTSLIS